MLKKTLEYPLFDIGGYSLSVYQLTGALMVFAVMYVLLRAIRMGIYRSARFDASRKYVLYQVTRYVLIVVSIILALGMLGVHLSVLLASSTALLVGIGLGLQSLVKDFVSGLILLLDGSIRVGDVIEVNGIVAKVEAIDIRTTRVLTRDDKYMIMPNSILTSNELINWTYYNRSARFEVSVGVDYDSDPEKVMSILREAAAAHPLVMPAPPPTSRIAEFGNSSIDFKVFFSSEEVFRAEIIRGDIRLGILQAFRREGISIPFPQRVIHHANAGGAGIPS